MPVSRRRGVYLSGSDKPDKTKKAEKSRWMTVPALAGSKREMNLQEVLSPSSRARGMMGFRFWESPEPCCSAETPFADTTFGAELLWRKTGRETQRDSEEFHLIQMNPTWVFSKLPAWAGKLPHRQIVQEIEAMNMKLIQDMNSMRARVALALALSAGLICAGTVVVGCKSSPPVATPTGVVAGATTNPDGSVTNPDGSVTYPPGSAQAAAAQGIKNADGSVTNGNGSVTYSKSSPQAKSEPGPGGTPPAAAAAASSTPTSGPASAPAVAAAPEQPPPPPPPQVLTVHSGAAVSVSISQQLSASKNSVGDGFSGVLASSIKDADGAVLYPRGTRVQGTVIASKGQGRFKGAGALGSSSRQSAGSGSARASMRRRSPARVNGRLGLSGEVPAAGR